jgi:hypothetical protein
MNVSFTRARAKLVLFGSRKTLQRDPLLAQFFKLMDEQKWVVHLPHGSDSIHMKILGGAVVAQPSSSSSATGCPRRGSQSRTEETVYREGKWNGQSRKKWTWEGSASSCEEDENRDKHKRYQEFIECEAYIAGFSGQSRLSLKLDGVIYISDTFIYSIPYSWRPFGHYIHRVQYIASFKWKITQPVIII